ncbi:hypothetical protein ACFQDG_08240 [Natronoarchaeum mannanilyticum]|uniref:DUF7344 domain-containing protein n=1 Tax=Natronoarchaeum mannanilyticum TaxID=926360 RepID=A0AAV3T5H1_9EURY
MSVTRFADDRALSEATLTSVVDPRRRAVLAALQGEQTVVDRRDLAAKVAAVENDAAPAAVEADAVDDVLLTLHHVHLPKLDDAGYLTYDTEENEIEPRTADVGEPPLLAEF